LPASLITAVHCSAALQLPGRRDYELLDRFSLAFNRIR